MTYLYNDLFYGCKLFDFLFFFKNCCMHLLKSFYFLSIGNLLCFLLFFDNIHGLSFHFYLYSIKDENTFYFEEFEIYIFVFCFL